MRFIIIKTAASKTAASKKAATKKAPEIKAEKPEVKEERVEQKVETTLKALYSLQQIDSQVDKIRIIRGELPLEVQDLEDEIVGLETRVNNFKEEVEKEVNIFRRREGKREVKEEVRN